MIGRAKDRIGDGSDAVRNDDLLAEPEAKPIRHHTRQGDFVYAALAKFLSDLPVADDRTGDKLREQRVVDSEFRIACRSGDAPTVNVSSDQEMAWNVKKEIPIRQRYCGRRGKRCERP